MSISCSLMSLLLAPAHHLLSALFAEQAKCQGDQTDNREELPLGSLAISYFMHRYRPSAIVSSTGWLGRGQLFLAIDSGTELPLLNFQSGFAALS